MRRLMVSQFRNYSSLNLEFGHDPIILTGPNGAGKTNLMEAVSLLAPGRGLRRASRDDFQSFAPDSSSDSSPASLQGSSAGMPAMAGHALWAVSASIDTPIGPVDVGTGRNAEKPDGARIMMVNGAKSTAASVAELFAVSWLTPQMDGLFIGSPSARRRFIDRLVIAFDPAHSGRLSRYEKLYRERQKLVQEQGAPSWLSVLETQLAETGTAIMAARAALCRAISETAYQGDKAFGFPRLHMAMSGGGCSWLDEMPALAVEEKIAALAADNRRQGDLSMPGPQAQDLNALYLDKNQPAHLGSTGEQKALMIAAILAHARLQASRLDRPPLLLLDDVAAHLDEDRRYCLFAATSELKGQVWYSGTDRDAFRGLAQIGQFFAIEDGMIQAA